MPSRAIRFFAHKTTQKPQKNTSYNFRSKVHGQTDRQNTKTRMLSLFLSFTARKIKHGRNNSLPLQPLGGNRSSHVSCGSGVPFQPSSVLLLNGARHLFSYMGGLWEFLCYFFSPFFFFTLLSLMIFTRRWTREQQQYSMLQRSRQHSLDIWVQSTLVRFRKLYGTLCSPFFSFSFPIFLLLLFFSAFFFSLPPLYYI